jgi:protein-S-isoprenylcysteine O-methyltransferase Ste14
MVLQSTGYALVWSIRSVAMNAGKPPSATRLVVSMFVGPVSVAMVWSAVKNLGKQWRVDAALNQDHDLVKTGAYSLLRHPIYASMLGMLLASGLMWTWWPLLPVAIARRHRDSRSG